MKSTNICLNFQHCPVPHPLYPPDQDKPHPHLFLTFRIFIFWFISDFSQRGVSCSYLGHTSSWGDWQALRSTDNTLFYIVDAFNWEYEALNPCCVVNDRTFAHHPEDCRFFFFHSVKLFNLSDRLFPRGFVGTFPYKRLMKPLSVSWNADVSDVFYQTKARRWGEDGKKAIYSVTVLIKHW